MAFKNEDLNQLSDRFKKRYKALNKNVKAWAADSGISLNTAYSYMDTNRPDNHLPAFLLATLPEDIMENILQMLRDMSLFKTKEKHHGHHINELLVLHYQYLKEFSDVTRSLVEAMEDGKITEDEFERFVKERAEFLAVDAKLYARLHEEVLYSDDDYYT